MNITILSVDNTVGPGMKKEKLKEKITSKEELLHYFNNWDFSNCEVDITINVRWEAD